MVVTLRQVHKLRARLLKNPKTDLKFLEASIKKLKKLEISINFESFEENAQISEENKVQNDGGEVSRKHIGAYCQDLDAPAS